MSPEGLAKEIRGFMYGCKVAMRIIWKECCSIVIIVHLHMITSLFSLLPQVIIIVYLNCGMQARLLGIGE